VKRRSLRAPVHEDLDLDVDRAVVRGDEPTVLDGGREVGVRGAERVHAAGLSG